MRLNRYGAIALILFAAAVPALAQETEPAVPALSDFHEVIYPIWHTAYPEKDVAMLKSLAPQVNELAAKICEAKLPGILREKQAKYDAGLAEFRAAVDGYNAAEALAGLSPQADAQAFDQAVQRLHGRYQEMEKIFD